MRPARLLRASFTLGVLPVSIRRFPLFALSLFLALLLFPSCAFALDIIPKGVIYQGDVQGTNYGAVVSAYNQYDAACYVLGKDPNTISSTIKAKLSDSNYGGKFYEYAQSFFTQSGGLEDMPEWVPTYIFWGSEVMDLVLADYQAVWYSTTTKALHDAALVDFARILNGEDLGGGSGSVVPDGEFSIYTLTSFASRWDHGLSGDFNFYNAYGAGYSGGVITLTGERRRISPWANSTYYFPSSRGYFSSSVINFANDLLLDGYDVIFLAGLTGTKVNEEWSSTLGGVLYGHDLTMGTYHGQDGNFTFTETRVYGSDMHRVYFDDVSVFYYDSLSPFIFVDGDVISNRDTSSPFPIQCFASIVYEPFSPLPPGGDWPEPEPTPTPTAPDLPEPVEPTVTPDPVVTEPTPTWPDFNITVNPPAVIVPETPEGLDYTALLTLINDNLESIDAYTVAINSTLNSLRSDLVTEFDGVVQSLRNIYSYLQHMDSVLERHCVHLQNKMEDVSVDIQNKIRELVHWLAEQLDFDSESSGNSDLFGILSTISDKLGGGTYEPNPIRDELGYYEWLDNLWDRFLLGDNWQASAGSISQSFGQLTSRFPFSVPWDIVALFRLFVHDPVTPVFDLPLYYSADDYATVHVDLSGWDGVAAVVRPLVFVIFALNLALLSRHLLAGFGADKGGL